MPCPSLKYLSLPAALLCALLLAGCAAAPQSPGRYVELLLKEGWYDGKPVHYVTTDLSDPGMARAQGVNYAPRLADALPDEPPRPGQRTVLERIYNFPGGEQGGVMPSRPTPVGPDSSDRSYSPLWQLVLVRWAPGQTPHTLRSEEQVLAAADRGQVTLTKTRVVANCPVVLDEAGGALRGARLVMR